MKKVLFVCGENTCRSQMAEAFYNSLAINSTAESAGTFPAEEINPMAVQVMGEAGIDISDKVPRRFDAGDIDQIERIISFGCIARAAFPRPEKLEEWQIEDPAGKDIDFFREVRDEIRSRVRSLVVEVEKA
jgi:arsenate reductase (thioredoxin)